MAKTNNEKNRESEARRKAGGEKKASVWVPIGRVAELTAIMQPAASVLTWHGAISR